MTAEYLADDYDISRSEQDELALRSHHKAAKAQADGRFGDEIVPVEVTHRRKTATIDTDEHVRGDVVIEKLGKLPPVFRPDGGSVHAGNSSGITDGAAALLMTTESEAKRRGLEPLARLGASAVAGVSPRVMGIGPVPAVRDLCAKTGRSLGDFDLIELNEAFAAQVIACDRELGLNHEVLNVNGGAIAMGHPLGATGAMILGTVLDELERTNKSTALVTLCIGGGMGIAQGGTFVWRPSEADVGDHACGNAGRTTARHTSRTQSSSSSSSKSTACIQAAGRPDPKPTSSRSMSLYGTLRTRHTTVPPHILRGRSLQRRLRCQC